MKNIRAILFDKDGTLFDFQATWGAWAQRLLTEFSGNDRARADEMAQVLGFDLTLLFLTSRECGGRQPPALLFQYLKYYLNS